MSMQMSKNQEMSMKCDKLPLNPQNYVDGVYFLTNKIMNDSVLRNTQGACRFASMDSSYGQILQQYQANLT